MNPNRTCRLITNARLLRFAYEKKESERISARPKELRKFT